MPVLAFPINWMVDSIYEALAHSRFVGACKEALMHLPTIASLILNNCN
jgi:hypothetical protein